MPSPSVTFVCALHNCIDLTREMLRSLEETESLDGKELIFVDDASTDSTPLFLEGLASRPQIRVLRNDHNQGFARSNNRAVRHAASETLVFINNDLVFDQPWLQPMLDLLEANNVATVGNIQRNARTKLVDHAGIFFNLDGMPTHAHKNRGRPPSGDWRERNAVTAACMAMRRDLFVSVGGFDKGYRNGFEDVDLCIRLRRKGFRHLVSHRSIVRHHVSSSPGRHDNNDANSERFRRKHALFTRSLGRAEWPLAYLNRYGRHWWKMEPKLVLKALFLLTFQPQAKSPSQPPREASQSPN